MFLVFSGFILASTTKIFASSSKIRFGHLLEHLPQVLQVVERVPVDVQTGL